MTTDETNLERSRTKAVADVVRLLGITDRSVSQLLGIGRDVLGSRRGDRCLTLARLAPLTRRAVATSAIAGLIVGTRELGLDWWVRPYELMRADRTWETVETPDALLERGHRSDDRNEDGGSCLDQLQHWIADAAADVRWGRPVDFSSLLAALD